MRWWWCSGAVAQLRSCAVRCLLGGHTHTQAMLLFSVRGHPSGLIIFFAVGWRCRLGALGSVAAGRWGGGRGGMGGDGRGWVDG